ncbi:hypothetical protein MGWOODY_Smn3535 [hydrothermal vent metagenome]|uniref:Uncharacterized protein n=1 Tax=hydrothermal vent metagenome TaxID=652676 RepID=A0A160TPW6_9ZZZZ
MIAAQEQRLSAPRSRRRLKKEPPGARSHDCGDILLKSN